MHNILNIILYTYIYYITYIIFNIYLGLRAIIDEVQRTNTRFADFKGKEVV